jgi:ABC-type branched-subunit amino acid transport system ATPase component/ABC-type branched-subunit amino acid transport system permease subunit
MTLRNRVHYLARRNVAFFITAAVYAAVVLALLPTGLLFADVLVTSGTFFILVMSLDLVYGYAGLLSLGHIGFFAMGAYGVAILANHLGWAWVSGALLSLLFSIFVGIVLGYAFARLRGSYFMLGTLAFGLVIQALIRVWFSLTGGDAGLGNVPRPDLFGFELRTHAQFGAFVWLIAAVLFWISINLTRSRVGRALSAIRGDEVSAAASGVNVGRLKINVLALSALYASLSGSLFASYNNTVHPESFSLAALLDLLMMLFFGGEGTVWGALIGATIMRILPDVIGPFHAAKLLLSGIAFVLIIFLFPRGLGGTLISLGRSYRRRSQNPPSDASGEPAVFSSQATAATDSLLSVERLSRSFGGLRAVDEVSFSIKPGRVKSLIGPNGAGKTTMLNLISGILTPDAGEVRLHDRELRGLRPDQISRLGLQRTFQHERLFARLNVAENVMIGCERGADGSLREFFACMLATPRTLDQEIAARREALHCLALVGLSDQADRAVGDLPHGQRKLVELARAIAARPQLLLLDETAAGLNDMEKNRFKEIIRRFCGHGMAVVLIEHDIDFVMELSNEIVVMNFGRKIADATPSEVSRDQAVLAAYLGV